MGEWVAIINWLPSLTSSSIRQSNDNCLWGDNAASGSSRIYKPWSENIFWTNYKNDSPWEHSCKLPPYELSTPILSTSVEKL